MALPKVNTMVYDLVLPASEKKIKYRPFLVREQKILLTAYEGKDPAEIISAIKQIIENCVVEGDLKIGKTPSVDLELLFLRMREKSIGTTIDMLFRHTNGKNIKGEACSHVTPITIDTSKATVVGLKSRKERTIQLTDTIGIVMQYFTFEDAEFLSQSGKLTQEIFQQLIINNIECIYDGNDVFPASESTKDELEEFLLSLSTSQFEKIVDFIQKQPKLYMKIEYECKGCKEKEVFEIEGLMGFTQS